METMLTIAVQLIVISGSFLACAFVWYGYGTAIEAYQKEMITKASEKPNRLYRNLFRTAWMPEGGFFYAFPNRTEADFIGKSKLAVFLFLTWIYLSFNLLYAMETSVDWQAIGYMTVIAIVLFLVTHRVTCVYQMIQWLPHLKRQKSLSEQIEERNTDFLDKQETMRTQMEKLKPLVKQKLAEQQKVNQLEQQITSTKENIRNHQLRQAEKQSIVNSNLDAIYQLSPDTEIAIDSNVLMKCDEYIFQALKERKVLISKKVQQELDKNKLSDNEDKAYRARKAIRRLTKLNQYRFVVSKWDHRFMQVNDLLSGVADDEIIADYLYEQQRGKKLVVISDDNNFAASAKVHLPLLPLKQIGLFTEEENQ